MKHSRPAVKNEPAVTRVVAACEALALYVESDDFNADRLLKYENDVLEAAIEAVYGPSFWDYINSRL